MNNYTKQVFRFLVLSISFLLSNIIYAQNTLITFGKNRVQYEKFEWKSYETDNFEIYYNKGGVRAAKFAAYYLEEQFNEITDVLGYTPYTKAKVLIYNSISDLQQSNIGLGKENLQIGGQTNFFKSQVEVAYTGSIEEFKQELRYGISQVYVHEMLYGGSLKDMLQSTYLSEFSEWFQLGAAAYIAKGWNEEMDNYVRNLVAEGKLKKPTLFSDYDAIIIGQSVWNFIAEKHGKENISSILNLARIIRNEKNSVSSTLGISYRALLREWRDYYKEMYEKEVENMEVPEYDYKMRWKNRKNFFYNDICLSPDGSKIAYSEVKEGKIKVIVRDLGDKKAKKKKVIFRGGYNAIYQRFNPDMPALSWKDNQTLGIIYMEEGMAKLEVHDINAKKKLEERTWKLVQQVHSFDFSDDGFYVIISGGKQGRSDFKTAQNDLFLYDIELDYVEELTSDWADDLYPTFLSGSSTKIVFSSNRLHDTLKVNRVTDLGPYNEPTNEYDLYILDTESENNLLQRITISGGNTTRPMVLDDRNILYLSDRTGVHQLYRYNFTSGSHTPLTNFTQSIENFDMNPQSLSWAFSTTEKGRPLIFYQDRFIIDKEAEEYITTRKAVISGKNDIPELPKNEINVVEQENTQEPFEEDEVNTDNYIFDDEFDDENNNQPTLDNSPDKLLFITQQVNQKEISLKGAYDYRPLMRTDDVTTSFFLDPFRGFGFVFNMSLGDLLENHRIEAGLVGFGDLRTSTFFGEYQYLGNRLDYSVRYEKHTLFLDNESVLQRYRMNRFEATVAYPLTNLTRISVTPFYANTRAINMAPGLLSLPDIIVNYAGLRIEYVYDKTRITGTNMMQGTRVKIRLENHFAIAEAPRSFNNLEIEFRNYFKIHKELILASRISYGRFGGSAPKNYLLGGVDNWIGNQTDSNGENDPLLTEATFDNSDLLFVEFVTPLRGFNYNKLFGTNYLVANAELRLPIVKYLFGKRINSNFLQNLQFVGFTDIGSAWSVSNPFSRENSLNTRNIRAEGSPFSATVNNFKNPFIVGYGVGARTTLLGYYLKFDLAWAVEDFVTTQSPRLFVSFGYDF